MSRNWIGPDGAVHEPYLCLVIPGTLLALTGLLGLIACGAVAVLRRVRRG